MFETLRKNGREVNWGKSYKHFFFPPVKTVGIRTHDTLIGTLPNYLILVAWSTTTAAVLILVVWSNRILSNVIRLTTFLRYYYDGSVNISNMEHYYHGSANIGSMEHRRILTHDTLISALPNYLLLTTGIKLVAWSTITTAVLILVA